MERLAFLACCVFIVLMILGCVSGGDGMGQDEVGYLNNFMTKCARPHKSC